MEEPRLEGGGRPDRCSRTRSSSIGTNHITNDNVDNVETAGDKSAHAREGTRAIEEGAREGARREKE